MPKYPVDNGSSSVELTDVISRRLLASYYSRPPATSKHESTYLSLRDEFWTCHRNLLFSPTRKTNSLFNCKLVRIIAIHKYDVWQMSVEIFSTKYRVYAENNIYLAHGICPVRNLVYLRISNDCHIGDDRMQDLISLLPAHAIASSTLPEGGENVSAITAAKRFIRSPSYIDGTAKSSACTAILYLLAKLTAN